MTRTELYNTLVTMEGQQQQADKLRIACRKVIDDMTVVGSIDGTAASTAYTVATLEEAIRCYKMAYKIEADCVYQRRMIRNGYQLAIGLRGQRQKHNTH